MSEGVAVVVSERLARYGFGTVTRSVRTGSPRSCASSRRVASTARPGPRAARRHRRGAARLPHPLTSTSCASARRVATGCSMPATRRPSAACTRRPPASWARRSPPMEAIMRGECRRAFVPIAGLHHAAREPAAGFCVFNDCGVAIELLQARGLEARRLRRHRCASRRRRVLRLRRRCGGHVRRSARGRALPLSRHRRGRGDRPRCRAAGTKLNVPLPPGADDAVSRRSGRGCSRTSSASQPEFIILQCGADSLEGDPITHLRFSAEVARARGARRSSELADRLGHGRVLALGGGGYNRGNLAQAWSAVVENLL